MANTPQTPFPTIQPSGPNGPTAQEFTRLQGNIANSLKSLSAATSSFSPIVASYYMSKSHSPSAGQPLNFDTVLIDTNDSVSIDSVGTSWKFTADATGVYSVGTSLNGSVPDQIIIYKNGSPYLGIGVAGTISTVFCGATIPMNSGDYISIVSNSGSTYYGQTPPTNGGTCSVSIVRVS